MRVWVYFSDIEEGEQFYYDFEKYEKRDDKSAICLSGNNRAQFHERKMVEREVT